MRLSMVLTGHGILQLFRESLATGNLALLRKTATQDFNGRVWQRIEKEAIAEFTPRLMTNRVEETIRSEYNGSICKITVRQMGVPVTYVLRDHKGQVAVDDVLITQSEEVALLDQAASMKETMELMIPLRIFREALAKSDMGKLQRNSSVDFNQMIWKQADNVPAVGQVAVKHLKAPLSKVENLAEGKSLITLGDENFGCSVMLVTEHERKVVDDIVLVAGKQPELRARLKHKMREQLAMGGPAGEAKPQIQQAGSWEDVPSSKPTQHLAAETVHKVQHADLQEYAPLPAMQSSPVPLPTAAVPPEREATLSEAKREPKPLPAAPQNALPKNEPGTIAPPLFPGGEADLEFVPEIKPSENAFDSPLETP